MKMIFEIGDRVELVEAQFLLDNVGATGTVTRVEKHHSDDGYSVHFVMDNPPKNRAQGYGIMCSADQLRYLEPEVPEEIAAELRTVLTKMGAEISCIPSSAYAVILRGVAKQALKALWLVANLDDYVNADTKPSVNRAVVEMKKTLIAKLKETA
jgi:hypothetical protein